MTVQEYSTTRQKKEAYADCRAKLTLLNMGKRKAGPNE
jgi:hypothetical protein